MTTICEENKCNGCMACIDRCPKNCISIDDSIYAYNAVKDMDICINCGQCKSICPNAVVIEKKTPIEWKQGWADSDIRCNSSSGGVAATITKAFIESGGYVASCLFEDGEFLFGITNNLEYAKRFAGSKYVKSNPVGIYKKVQERLKTGKVLFIGLPCQVAGLKNYIRGQERLYTIDLICHGTPSPKVLDKFLAEKNIDIRSLEDIKFRTKNSFGLSERGEYITPEGIDDYMMTFLDSVTYTDNCYECQFAEFNRVADLTLGDSWGTEYSDEEKNGVSLILIQTEKGHELVNSSNLTLFDVDIENAKNQNHQLRHPSIKIPERQVFLQGITEGKRFSLMTFGLYKKRIIKRYIKKALGIISGGVWNIRR